MRPARVFRVVGDLQVPPSCFIASARASQVSGNASTGGMGKSTRRRVSSRKEAPE
jgi:hypothetical protein